MTVGYRGFHEFQRRVQLRELLKPVRDAKLPLTDANHLAVWMDTVFAGDVNHLGMLRI